MISTIIQKHNDYSFELENIEAKIATERITNPAHIYCKKKIELEAKITLLEELSNEFKKS